MCVLFSGFRLILISCIFFYTSTLSYAGIQPQHESQLSTIHVMFEFEDVYAADEYILDIYPADITDKNHPAKPVVHIFTPYLSVLIKEGLSFGHQYRWQFTALQKNKEVYQSPFYQFNILSSPRVDTNYFRQQVINYGAAENDLILLDHSAIAIDKRGKPVWFLPLHTDSLDKLILRDVTMSPSGSITYIDQDGAYEKTLNGKLLWQGADDGKVSGAGKENYHHQLTKLEDGSYVVCGFIYKTKKKTDVKDAPRYNTIIHYNTDGSIRWSWDELTSLERDSLFKAYAIANSGGHLNGFAFTPDKSRMLLSFKNLSDVFVLNYDSGLFETTIKRSTTNGPVAFAQQHGPFVTTTGEILLYNNNINDDGSQDDKVVHPVAMVFQYNTAKKKISFTGSLPIETPQYPAGIRGKEGYMSETANGNYLVCAGGVNYSVEYTRKWQKKWEAFFYKRSVADTVWKPYSNYRCRSISSLYPLYYTLQYVKTEKGKHVFRIYNGGSTETVFNLIFTNEVGQKLYLQSWPIAPGILQLFSVPTGFVDNKPFSCTVQTIADKTQSKTYTYNTTTMLPASKD